MIADIIVIAAILISTVIAFLRGFIREVLTIVGVLGGLVAAYFGGPQLSPVVDGWLGVDGKDESARFLGILPFDLLADIISYGSIFIVVVIVLSVASHFLAHGAKAVGLGAIDRVLGIFFGVARALVLLALLYLPVYLLAGEETRGGWFKGSHTKPFVEMTAAWMAGFLPESFTESIEDKAEDVKESEKGRQVRETLQEMDILAPAPKDRDEGAQEKTKDNGYEDETRQSLDELIKEEIDEDNSGT